jgi:hypothetical protein
VVLGLELTGVDFMLMLTFTSLEETKYMKDGTGIHNQLDYYLHITTKVLLHLWTDGNNLVT